MGRCLYKYMRSLGRGLTSSLAVEVSRITRCFKYYEYVVGNSPILSYITQLNYRTILLRLLLGTATLIVHKAFY